MRTLHLLALLSFLPFASLPAGGREAVTRIACIGSGTARSTGMDLPERDSYPAHLQRLLGGLYEVRVTDRRAVVDFLPDIIFLESGPAGSLSGAGDEDAGLIRSCLQLSSHPRVVLLLPFPADSGSTVDPSAAISDSLKIAGVQTLAYSTGCEVLNLYRFLLGREAIPADYPFASAGAARLIALRLQEAVLLKALSGSGMPETAGVTGIHTSYFGFDCCEFAFEGRTARIVRPKRTAQGCPWIWRARFWGHEPQTEVALLERGFHLVYCDVAELFGNEQALGIWERFYDTLVRSGLSRKAVMEGLSRGGVYIYRWAVAHPDRVACVYADAPVLDFKSWPGGKGKGGGNPVEWERFKQDFGLLSEEAALAFRGNPLDCAGQIARGGFPMLHVCGDADKVVPIEENTDPFEKKILASGGRITVIRKAGIGHHPHSLTNPQPIVDFILQAVGER